jgi:GntR family transcriptional regulator
MLLHLTDLSDEPLQSQISRQIRTRVLSGDLPAGEPLPSIRSLARDNHVSVITVQRAYEHLLLEGLILSRRGKGFFVADLSRNRKKTMALRNLREKLEQPVREASAGGLTRKEIHDTVDGIIDEKA